MTEIIKETVTTQDRETNPTTQTSVAAATRSQTTAYVVYFILGTIEILLGFRLILKLTGANMASGFVNFIYGVSGIFIMPFEGIFRRAVNQGIETASILEPSTMVAMVVYAVIAWGVIQLVQLISGERQSE
jgi:hypothetical protein